MREYLELGPAPSDEPCAQVGSDDYPEKSRLETRVYKRQLERLFPKASFGVKSFEHDFGSYREVVVYYNPDSEEETEIAFEVESNLPTTWDEEALDELEGKKNSFMGSSTARMKEVLNRGFIRLKKFGKKWTGDTIADQEVIRSIINKSYFTDAEYDNLLFKASEWGLGLEADLEEKESSLGKNLRQTLPLLWNPAEILERVTILAGEGSIDLSDSDKVKVAIVYDSDEGYNPGAAIVAVQNRYRSEDAVLQDAFDVFEEYKREHERNQANNLDELYQEFINEGLSEDEAASRAWQSWTEGWSGVTFTLSAKEAAAIIGADTRASAFINIDND